METNTKGHPVIRTRAPKILLSMCLALSGCVERMPSGGSSAALGLYSEPWQWTSDSGLTVRFGDLRGRPVVLSAIYTHCTGACPLTLARMKMLEQALKARPLPVHFVLVTLDPAHDTPASLTDYRQRNGLDPARWVLLRGDSATTDALARRLSVHRIEDSAHLLHVSRTLVLDRNGALLGLWSGLDTDAALAALVDTTRHSEPH